MATAEQNRSIAAATAAATAAAAAATTASVTARAASSAAKAANKQLRVNGQEIEVVKARLTTLESVVLSGNADTAKVLRIVGHGKLGFRVFERLLEIAASAAVVLGALHFIQ
jgi:hypothetical protein